MRKPNGTEMKALFVLSIVVPVTLLSTFKLTGILRDPPIVEKITQEPAMLTIPRPSATIFLTNFSVQNEWLQKEVFISTAVSLVEYREGPNTPLPYYGHDGLMFATHVKVCSPKGSLWSARMSFHLMDEDAVLFASEERWGLNFDNATLITVQGVGTDKTDAYIQVESSNSSWGFTDEVFWVFLDDGGKSHELQVTVEAVETSAVSVRIVTIPIRLKVLASGT